MPHSPRPLYETPKAKVEICILCGVKKKWSKHNKKIGIGCKAHNQFHIRDVLQDWGWTKYYYRKIYDIKTHRISLSVPAGT